MSADSWRLLGLQSIGSNWVYTPASKGCFFRFSFIPPFRAYKLLVAQCQFTGGKLEIFDTRTVYPRSEAQIFQFEPPPFFAARRIGIRGIAGQKALVKVEVSRFMPIYPDQPNPSATSGTTTTVAASITSVTLLPANSSRKGASIYNNSALATLYLGFGATVTTTAFAEKLAPNSLWEMPLDYDGQIVGIWSAASGNALITEFV